MLHLRRRVLHLDVGEGVGAALLAQQQRIALGMVARAIGALEHLHQPPVGLLPVAGRDALGDDGALRVPADMHHLGAGVRLLVVVGQRHGIELAHRLVAQQHAARILPGDGAARLHLRPRDARARAAAFAALGDEVVDAAAALLVARVPVLHRGILDVRALQRHQFHHRRVQLVLVAHRRRAAFEVAHVAALVGDDQRALELAGIGRVDAEIGGQLHRAAHALRHIDEGAVGEDGRIQRREEIVRRRHHAAQIPAHQFRMLGDGLRDGAEDDAGLGQLLAEGGGHGHRIEDRVHGHAGQHLLLVQRNAELLVGFQKLRIHLVETLRRILLRLRGRVVGNGLVVDGLVMNVRPVRLGHRPPVAIGFQAPLGHPFRLVLLGRNQPDDVLVQPRRRGVRFDVGDEAGIVLVPHQRFDVALLAHLSPLHWRPGRLPAAPESSSAAPGVPPRPSPCAAAARNPAAACPPG